MKLTSLLLAFAMAAPMPAVADPAAPTLDKVQTYLFDAARAGNAGLIADLVRAGGRVDARNDAGYSAFVLAAYNGRGDAVAALLAAGADPNLGDKRGNTALMGAIFKGEEAIALRLIAEPRVDVDARNGAGQTAAMFAALFGRPAVVDALALRGADFKRADAAGQTAEALARQQGNDVLAARIAALVAQR